MAKRKKKGHAGNGLGPHHEVSPLARATATKTRKGRRRQEDRRAKQRGWSD